MIFDIVMILIAEIRQTCGVRLIGTGFPVIAVVDEKFEELTRNNILPADLVIGVTQKISRQFCCIFFTARGVTTADLPVQFSMGK